MSESTYDCPECGLELTATASTLIGFPDGRLIGVCDSYSHECNGKLLHPFAITPFEDIREELWEHLRSTLKLSE